MVIEAYFDESGTHRGSPILCVAASFARHLTWASFERKWSKILRDNNTQRFHSKDPSCDFLWPHPAILIKEHQIFNMVCSVNPDIYREYASVKMRSQMDAYSTCACACALEVSDYARINNLGRVAMVLEVGQPNGERVARSLGGLFADPNFLVSSVSLVAKQDFIQLNVPDFLSHICSTSSPWFDALLNSGGTRHISLHKQALERFSSDMGYLIARHQAEKRRAKRSKKS